MNSESAIVRNIVDRCHVGTRYVDVLKYLVSRINGGYKTWKTLTRAQRKEIMRVAFARHRANNKLFRSVMTGRF